MKKILLLAICLMLVGIPITSGLQLEKQIYQIPEQTAPIPEDIPQWAIGNFTGVWGLNINGQPTDPIGLIAGYYGTYRFVGIITNSTAPNGWIAGFTFRSFLIGRVGNLSGENTVPVIGIGIRNETGFYYRVMSFFGPTIYIAGIYHPF